MSYIATGRRTTLPPPVHLYDARLRKCDMRIKMADRKNIATATKALSELARECHSFFFFFLSEFTPLLGEKVAWDL